VDGCSTHLRKLHKIFHNPVLVTFNVDLQDDIG